MSAKTEDAGRCWPGYEPVPGKRANEQGSCRPKAKSKLSPKEKGVRVRRRQQLNRRKRAGVPAKQRSARRRAMSAPKGVSKAHREGRPGEKRRARSSPAGKTRRRSAASTSRQRRSGKSSRRTSRSGRGAASKR